MRGKAVPAWISRPLTRWKSCVVWHCWQSAPSWPWWTSRWQEAQASGATGEDAVRAYEEFERERARINATAEGSAEEAPADDSYAEEPPPE